MSELTRKKKIFFTFITLMIGLIFSVITLELTVRIYENFITSTEHNDKRMYQFDEQLGWTLVDGNYTQTHRDFTANYTIEHNSRKTITQHSQKIEQINFYGDSFCFGTGMDDRYTIQSFFAKLYNKSQVNNYGVSGYGPLQYFMSYQKTESDDLNIFLIYTGNDYRDIQIDRIEWGAMPMLVKKGKTYEIKLPPKDSQIITNSSKNVLEFKSWEFIKYQLKSIPFVVSIRNEFIQPDKEFTQEAINRFDHIYAHMDRQKTLFVVLPSISLTTGISTKSDEGAFHDELIAYLKRNNFKHLDILSSNILEKNDFWPHEGHNNIEGNRKIANAIHSYLLNADENNFNKK